MAPHASASPEEAAARAFVDEMAHGAWNHPKTPFAPTLAVLTPEKLQGAWSEVESLAGRFFECKDA